MPQADLLLCGQLVRVQIPLPPLPEQKWIAAIVNEQIATVERTRKAALEDLEVIAALLRRAFSGEL